jgi:hypothetical protein
MRLQPITTGAAVLSGSIVLAIAILGASTLTAYFGPQFEISAGSNGAVWRLNLRTGLIDQCWVVRPESSGDKSLDKYDPSLQPYTKCI